MRNRKLWLLCVKVVLLAVFIIATNRGGIGKRSLIGYVLFFVAWACSLISLVHITFFGRRWNRIAWAVLVVASAIVGSSYAVIFQAPLALTDLEKLIPLIPFIDSVFQFYWRPLLAPILFCLLGAVAITLPSLVRASDPASLRQRLRGLALQLSPILVMIGALLIKHGEGTNGLAVQYTSLAFLPTLELEHLAAGRPPERHSVTLVHSGQRPLSNVIVVMDESIRGDLVDLNWKEGATTGLLGRPDVINFGTMSSISNCSLETNLSFRYGVGRKSYLHQLDVNPSVWSYAKVAGYSTYYFDAQRTGGALQNGMDAKERQDVGVFFQVPSDVKLEDRDIELAKALRRAVDEQPGTPKFFYVNKMGSHYPYEGKYPPARTRWKPVMRADFFDRETLAADSTGCGCHCGENCKVMRKFADNQFDTDLRRRFKNSYLNAVSWTTSAFFETLLDGLDLSNTMIVYMSDHGQDFHEDGRPGLNTHCTPGDASPSEGIVPFAVVTGNPAMLAELRADATLNFNRVSQFSVFPSLLGWMGYPRDAIAKLEFDPSIDRPSSSESQRFLSRFYVRLGGQPVWVSTNTSRAP